MNFVNENVSDLPMLFKKGGEETAKLIFMYPMNFAYGITFKKQLLLKIYIC